MIYSVLGFGTATCLLLFLVFISFYALAVAWYERYSDCKVLMVFFSVLGITTAGLFFYFLWNFSAWVDMFSVIFQSL
jgi:hypothetical protein